MGSRHSRAEIKTFLAGETAQVVAKDTRDGELVIMRQGQADELRAITKKYFECPIEGCADPRLETVGGHTERRHHFRHQSGGDHSGAAESLFHYQSKWILGEWARSSAKAQGIDVEVQIDDAFVGEAGQRKRKPDVLIHFQEDQGRLAIEVEYFNSTDETTLGERRSDYSIASINDIWIFGHASRHIRTPRSDASIPDGFVKMSSVPAAIAAAGQPILVINPLDRLVGTLVRTVPPTAYEWWKSPQDFGLILATSRWAGDTAEIYLDPLDDCRLDSTFGILTPTIEKVLKSRQEMKVLAVDAEQFSLRRKAELLAQEERAARDKQWRQATAIRLAAAQEKAWESHPLRLQLISQDKGIPAVISMKLRTDFGVHAHHEHWHALLFEQFITTRPVGATFTVPDLYRCFKAAGIELHKNPEWRSAAIIGYLKYLRTAGFVNFEPSYSKIEGDITILAKTMAVNEASRQRQLESTLIHTTMGAVHWHITAIDILRSNPSVSFQTMRERIPEYVPDQEIRERMEEILAYWAGRSNAGKE